MSDGFTLFSGFTLANSGLSSNTVFTLPNEKMPSVVSRKKKSSGITAYKCWNTISNSALFLAAVSLSCRVKNMRFWCFFKSIQWFDTYKCWNSGLSLCRFLAVISPCHLHFLMTISSLTLSPGALHNLYCTFSPMQYHTSCKLTLWKGKPFPFLMYTSMIK